jgi:hypothetical protein
MDSGEAPGISGEQNEVRLAIHPDQRQDIPRALGQ